MVVIDSTRASPLWIVSAAGMAASIGIERVPAEPKLTVAPAARVVLETAIDVPSFLNHSTPTVTEVGSVELHETTGNDAVVDDARHVEELFRERRRNQIGESSERWSCNDKQSEQRQHSQSH